MKALIFQRALQKLRSANRFMKEVRQEYSLKPVSKFQITRSYYDSFDWRLFRENFVLERNCDQETFWVLRPVSDSGGRFLRQNFEGEPVFLEDLPPGPIREILSLVLGVRALLKSGTAKIMVRTYELRDDLDKILLRLERENFLHPDDRGELRTEVVNFRLLPYRGYEKTAEKLLNLLDKVEAPGGQADPLHYVLKHSKRQPLDYSSKLKIPLTAELTMGQALTTALLFLLDILERNIEGIITDTDSEFLHDFRIAGRRSRSLITQVKNIFPSFAELPFKDAFSQLSVKTSENRDLDVFLQEFPDKKALLPAAMQQDLEPLYVVMKEDRNRRREILLKWLVSDDFGKFLVQWREFLNLSIKDELFEDKGKLPVLDVASHSIWKVYKRLIKQGKAVSRTNSFEDLHEVRKTAKKLRYLLETFRNLYPGEQIEQIVQELKRLQNLLGAIVDYHVQQMYLSVWADDMCEPGFSDATREAVKALITKFNELEDKSCRKFHGRFAEFSGKQNRDRFKLLFKRKNV